MKLVQVNISASEIILFTPLPQIHMTNAIVENEIIDLKQIKTLEYSNSESISKIFFDLVEYKPDIVTFSAYMWNFKVVDQISNSIKEWANNKCWVIWGGPHISEAPVRYIDEYRDSVDFIVTWYGEHSISQLLNSWKNTKGNIKQSKEEIEANNYKGIYFNREVKKDLLLQKDIYGYKAGDFIPLTKITEAYNEKNLPKHIKDNITDRVFMLESYRGCPFSCSYCLWGVASKKIDFISIERMITEFDNLINIGARQFNLADAGFGLKKERDMNFLKHIINLKKHLKININLSGYWFWQTLTDEMLELMKEIIELGIMGQLDVGIQTFNPAVTKLMKRPTNYKSFDSVIKKTNKLNIPFQMDLILGLPGDNYEGYLHSVQQVLKYGPNKFQTFPLSILPGSDYDRRRKELGIKTMRGSRTMDIDSIIETKSFKRAEIKKALRVESYFYLTYTLRLLNDTLRNLAKAGSASFFDVTMVLHDWSIKNKLSVFTLTDKYYKSLYENRHLGRKNLDIYLFDNYDQIHVELKNFIKYYIRLKNITLTNSYLFELLEFEMFLFPKRFNTISKCNTFKNIKYVDYEKKEIITNFNYSMIYKIFFRKHKKPKEDSLIKFKEPISNFREGGISTQYNFWKWNYSLE